MKTKILFLYLILFTTFLYGGGTSVEKIEALFYLNGEPVSIQIKDGIISNITPLDEKAKDTLTVYIAPGFIDIQINGYMGVDFSREGLSVEDVRKVTEHLWKEGVTTYFPTIITNSHQRIKTNFAVLAKSAEQEDIGKSIPGFHLEGPYISPEDGYRGAHLKEHVRKPSWEEFEQYYKASGGKILLVTVAPEIEGAINFTKKCTEKGITVGIGHTAATTEQIKKAADAGASISTHLGNGYANLIHRHYNPIWQQLADDRLTPTLIVDGHHLRREQVETFYKAKNKENIMLISDAVELAGMPPGKYVSGGIEVVMTEDGMLKYPEQNVLAGASFPLKAGIENLIKFTNCSLADAVNFASKKQAKHFNLTDRGEILPGKRADLVLFTYRDGKITVLKTVLAGKIVWER